MKRLLTLAAVALLACSTVGCECSGLGNFGLLRGGRHCNSCGGCESSSPCSSCGGGPAITSGCGCGDGGISTGAPIMNAPTIAPGPESYSMSHR